ncbi:hypothetical protein GF352_04200 [archaeon]|nr:hypothetical protein [archaeon]
MREELVRFMEKILKDDCLKEAFLDWFVRLEPGEETRCLERLVEGADFFSKSLIKLPPELSSYADSLDDMAGSFNKELLPLTNVLLCEAYITDNLRTAPSELKPYALLVKQALYNNVKKSL